MTTNRSSRLWVVLLMLLVIISASGMALAQQNTFGLIPIQAFPVARPNVAAPATSTPTPTPTPAGSGISTGPGQPITANTPTTVQLNGAPLDLVYAATSAETITVTARSLEPAGSLDPTVEVLDASGVRLGFNDDHDTNFNSGNLANSDSAIPSLALPGPGVYTIRVSTYSGVGAGRVEVAVQSGSGGGSSAPTGNTQTINDQVPANGAYTYNFNANAGDLVTVLVHSTDPNLDPKVAILSSDGTTLIENDDHDPSVSDPLLGQTDSAIVNFGLPTSGAYTIKITGFAASGGTFQMRLTTGGAGSSAGGSTGGNGQNATLTIGQAQTFTGNIASGSTYTQMMPFRAGDMITIAADAGGGDLDPNITLYDSQHNQVAYNDDRDYPARDLNSTIENVILQTTGQYEIDVAGYQETSGSFTLAVTLDATNAPLGDGEDKVFAGQIPANSAFTQTFSANAGDYVTITIQSLSQGFDTTVTLLGPDGTQLATNDDYISNDSSETGMAQTDSRIRNFAITQTGTYTVQISGYQGAAGNFAMVLNIKH